MSNSTPTGAAIGPGSHGDDTHPIEDQAGLALMGLTENRRNRLLERLKDECRERGFTYERDGRADVISLGAVPVVMSDAHAAELHRLAMAVRRVLACMPDVWLALPEVRPILPLAPAEESWVRETWSDKHHLAQGIVSRLDADLKLSVSGAQTMRLFEYNGVAVGGLYYATVAESLCQELVLPELGVSGLTRGPSIPDLMLGEIRRQGKAIGRKPKRILVLENKEWDSGITEAPQYVRLFREAGHEAIVGDPRDLELEGDEIRHAGIPYDFFYRHMEVRDLLELETDGQRLDAVRHAFRENRVISSLSGEFDHKSCWEVVADPAYSRGFPAADREAIQRYLPWTRVVREARTVLPDGREGDLLEEIRRHRERFVIKPNRDCGGAGVVIGMRSDESSWDGRIAEGLATPGEWVVQSFIDNTKKRFPVPSRGAEGRLGISDRYVAYGFAATEDGLGCLGRFSTDRVVNVSQGGGIMPVLRTR